MKTGLYALTFALMFLMTLSLASAATNFSVAPGSVTFNKDTTSIDFTITNDATTAITVAVDDTITITGEDGYTIDFTITGNETILNGSSQDFTITPDADIDFSEFNLLGDYSSDITITEGGDTETVTVNIEKDYCEEGCDNPGNLNVKIAEVNVKDGFGDEDDYWYLFDEIEIEVEVDNQGNWDIDNIEVEWELYSTNGELIQDGDESDFDLDEDDEETVSFTFTLDEDIEEFEGEDAILYVRATGENHDEDDEMTCDWASEQVEVITDDQFVIITDIEILGNVECGGEITITGEVWNVGDREQDEVSVEVYNQALGIYQEVEIGDIDEFDKEKLEVTLQIPEDAEEKTYVIELEVYDEDDDLYVTDEEEDDARFTVKLDIQGACKVPQSVVIVAQLDPVDQVVTAGRQMTVKVTLSNTGDEETTYQVLLSDYAEWAGSAEILPDSVTVEAGESADVYITLTPTKDAVGTQQFTVTALFGDETEEQDLEVTVEEATGFLSGITGWTVGGQGFKENWFIWTIAALNVLLVLVIIIIAARIARRSAE